MLPNPKREFGFLKTFSTTYYQYSSYESYNTTDLQASPKPYHPRYVNELIDTYQDGTDQNDYENEITENAETNSPNVFVFFIVRLLPTIPESGSGKYL